MPNFAEFLLTVAVSSAGTTVLLGTAAFLFRAQLSHWFTKDLEELKASHQRELEAYKVTLIADAERSKARQEVKTAKALWVAKRQFASLDRLHTATMGYAVKAAVLLRMPLNHNQSAYADVTTAVEEMIDALREAAIFLKPDEILQFHSLQSKVGEVLQLMHKRTEALEESEVISRETALFEAHAQALKTINLHVATLLEMN